MGLPFCAGIRPRIKVRELQRVYRPDPFIVDVGPRHPVVMGTDSYAIGRIHSFREVLSKSGCVIPIGESQPVDWDHVPRESVRCFFSQLLLYERLLHRMFRIGRGKSFLFGCKRPR